MNDLIMCCRLPVAAKNAGLFISRGKGEHPDRVISTYELIFVTRGTLSIVEGTERFDVSSGEILLLWPHRRHKAASQFDPLLQFYWLHFDLCDQAGDLRLLIPQHVTIRRQDHLTSLFRRFLDDQEGQVLSPLSANLLVMLMLAEVAASSRDDAVTQENESALASRVNVIIRTHYHEKLTTRAVAAVLHRNPDYLGRVYRNVYGFTITDAINSCRLKHARRLLLESEARVEDIAAQCGYSDAGYFRRLFKRSEGISPRRFRQLHARVHVNTG